MHKRLLDAVKVAALFCAVGGALSGLWLYAVLGVVVFVGAIVLGIETGIDR